MKFNIKVLNGVLSVALATTMTMSCFVGSVGAFRAPKASSKEVVEGIDNLNAKLENHTKRLRNAADKLCLFWQSKYKQNKGNVEKITYSMFNKLRKLEAFFVDSVVGLYDLREDIVYGMNNIQHLSEMLDGFVEDIDALVDISNRVEVDYAKDEVYLRNSASVGLNIALDENQENKDKTKLTMYKVNIGFGQHYKKLSEKILAAHRFAKNSARNVFQETVNSMSYENAELLNTWNTKLEKYTEIKSDLFDMKDLLHITGRNPSEITSAWRNLGTGSDGAISYEKKIEMLSSRESMQQSCEQLDVAIEAMERYIFKSIIKWDAEGVENIFSCLNDCINRLSDRQNIIISKDGEEKLVKEGFAASKKYKDINKDFTSAYIKLKALMRGMGDEGNLLMEQFKSLYIDLLDVYTFDANLSQNAFEQLLQLKAQSVRNKLNQIATKCRNSI